MMDESKVPLPPDNSGASAAPGAAHATSAGGLLGQYRRQIAQQIADFQEEIEEEWQALGIKYDEAQAGHAARRRWANLDLRAAFGLPPIAHSSGVRPVYGARRTALGGTAALRCLPGGIGDPPARRPRRPRSGISRRDGAPGYATSGSSVQRASHRSAQQGSSEPSRRNVTPPGHVWACICVLGNGRGGSAGRRRWNVAVMEVSISE